MMKFLAVVFVATTLAGCAATTPMDSEVTSPTAVLDRAFATATPGAAGIMVKRDLGLNQPTKCPVFVTVDGRRVLHLMPGEGARIFPPQGVHVFGVVSEGLLCEATSTVAVNVDPSTPASYRVLFKPYVGFQIQPLVD